MYDKLISFKKYQVHGLGKAGNQSRPTNPVTKLLTVKETTELQTTMSTPLIHMLIHYSITIFRRED